MKRHLVGLTAALALGACSDGPTSNTQIPQTPDLIVFGNPDGSNHPYVGFSLYYDPSVPAWFQCSGALLNDHVTFLTAGHCTFGVSTNGVTTQNGSGGHDNWVTFDEHVNLDTWSAATTLAAQRAALNANPSFTRGISLPHPDFGTAFPNTSDVGIVRLDAPKTLPQYARLAVPGSDSFSKHQIFDIAGFGLQRVKPTPIGNLDRYEGRVKLVQIQSGRGFFGPYNLKVSGNNGRPHAGAICFGDSGGPILIGNTVFAVSSYFWNSGCSNAAYAFRVDLPAIHDWILDQ
jgi:hypothetical protein